MMSSVVLIRLLNLHLLLIDLKETDNRVFDLFEIDCCSKHNPTGFKVWSDSCVCFWRVQSSNVFEERLIIRVD